MEIIEYTVSDAPHVASFFRQIFKELGWEERPSDFMDEPHRLFHLPDGGILLLAKDNGHVVGTAGVISLGNGEGLIKRFYLEDVYRGTGLAKELMDALFVYVRPMEVGKLVLDVSKTNVRAIHFYEKSGFLPTTVSSREDWPESNEPESHAYFYKNVM